MRKGDHHESVELPDVLTNWDYSVDLVLERSLELDLAGICRDTGLGVGTSFLLTVYLETGDLRVRRTVFQRTLYRDEEASALNLSNLSLPGEGLQGCLELITVLSLAQGVRKNPIAPVNLGSRLWQDTFKCQIEGGSSRLPMESRNFSCIGGRISYAPWYFELRSEDLYQRFESAFRAFLNTNRPDVHEPLTLTEPTITSLFRADLVRHVLSRILNADDFSGDEQDYPNGSLGAVTASWLDAAFPGENLQQIRQKAHDDARHFEAMISSVFGTPDGH
jgi:hypothetical protein